MAEEKDKENTTENISADAGANEAPVSLGSILNGAAQEEVFDAIAFLDSKPEKKSVKSGKKDKKDKNAAKENIEESDKKKRADSGKPVKKQDPAKAAENVSAEKTDSAINKKKNPQAEEKKQIEKKPEAQPAAKEKAEIKDEKKSVLPEKEPLKEAAKKKADTAAEGKKEPKTLSANDKTSVPKQAAGAVKNNVQAKAGSAADKAGAKAKAPMRNSAAHKAVPGKKKSLVVGILAFLLAGGAMFVLMTLQGAKDIKNTDAKMNFSYGNVIAGAVAPLFEALGITNDKSELEDATRKRVYDRSPEQFALNLADWTGEGFGSAAGDDSSSAAGGGSGSSGGRNYSGSAPSSEPYHKMEASLGSAGFGGGGGRSQTSSNGMSSFEKGSSADSVNTGGGNSYASGSKLPVGKGKGVETLRASGQMLSTGLTSGSANVARSQWSSAFGEGRSAGKTSGFSNGGKVDLNAYNSGGLANLDKIKSGEITDLKMNSIDGKSGAVPAASVPTMADKDKKGDENDKLIEKTLGDVAGTAANAAVDSLTSGSDKEKGKGSSGGKDSPNETGSAAGAAGQGLKPPSEFSNIAEKKDAEGGLYCPDGCEGDGFTYKDNPATYIKTERGNWLVSYTGEQKMDNGDIIKYEDKYIIRPGADPELTHLVSECVNPKTGEKVTSFREQL